MNSSSHGVAQSQLLKIGGGGVDSKRRLQIPLAAVLFALAAFLALWQPGAEAAPAQQATVPGVPTNLILTSDVDSITLSWTAPTSDGGSPITYYHITYQRGDTTRDYWTDTDGPPGSDPLATTLTISDLDVGRYEVTVTAGNTNGEGDPVTGTIATSTYVTPVISIVSDSLDEGATTSIVVRIDPAPAGAVNFDYQASRESGNTAAVGDTFAIQTGLDISNEKYTDGFFDDFEGNQEYSLYIEIVQDAIDEDDETFTLTLSNLTGSDATFEGGTGTLTKVITLIDDDRAASAPQKVHAYEDDSGLWVAWDEPADLGEEDGATGSIQYYEYRTSTTSGSLAVASWDSTFDTGTSLLIANPTTGNHYFQVRAITHYNGAIAGAISNVAAATADTDVVFAVTTPGFIVTEGESADLRVRLATQPTANVTLSISESSADISLDKSSLTFTPTDFDSDGSNGFDDYQAIKVTAREDDMDDADEAAIINFTVTSTDPNYGGKTVVASVIIEDDESTLVPPENFQATPRDKRIDVSWDAQTGAASYTITWSCGSASAQTHTTADGDATTYTIPGLTNGTECSVSMRANGTEVDGGTFDSASTASMTATPLPLVVVTPTVLSLNENLSHTDNTGEYTIVLTQEPTNTVFILVNNPDSSKLDISAGSSGELTFTPSDYDQPQTVSVFALQDDDPVDDTLTVTNTVSHSSDPAYSGLVIDSVTVTVTDKDHAAIDTSPSSLDVTEGNQDTFNVFLSSKPAGNIVVNAVSADTDTVTVSPDKHTIAPDDYFSGVDFTVTAQQDSDGSDATVQITFSINTGESVDKNYPAPNIIRAVNVFDDDTRGVTLAYVTYPDVNENGGTATYTLVLDTKPTGPVTIRPQSSDVSSATVMPSSLTFDASNWDDPQTVAVTGVNDNIDNSNDFRSAIITHSVSGGDYGEVDTSASDLFISVNDDDTRGVTVTATDPLEVPESGSAQYTVVLNTQPTGTVTVTPEVDGNSADPGSVTVSGPLTFDASNWSDPQTVNVTGVNDNIDNAGEMREATVTHTVSGADYASESADSVNLHVTDDDDDPTVGLVLNPDNISESSPGNVATVTATLSHPSDAATTITVTTMPAAGDFALSSTPTLTIAAGATTSTGTVTIMARDDADSVADVVSVGATVVNTEGFVAPAARTLTITDDDSAGVTVSAADPFAVPEGMGADYTVQLVSQPTGNVVINIGVTGSSDVSTTRNQLLFDASNWSDPQTVTVNASDDQDAVADTATITHTIDQGATVSEYDGVSVQNISVQVTENDFRGIVIDTDSVMSGVQTTPITIAEADGEGADYSIRLESQPTATVTISVRSSDTSIARVTPGSLRFTPTNWSDRQEFTVHPVPNDIDDPGDRRTATFSHTVSGGDYAGDTAASVTVDVTDDDTRGISVDTDGVLSGVQSTPITVVENATAIYTVVLTSQPTGTVTVTPNSLSPDVATVSPASLRFTSGNWSQARTVTVRPVNDDKDNAGEKRTATLRNDVAAPGSDYVSVSASSVTVDVTDDEDDPTVSLAVAPSAIVENGEAALITATQSIVSDADTIVTVTATPDVENFNVDFELLGTTLTIPAGQTGSVGLVSIRARRDANTADYTVAISGNADNIEGVNDPADVQVTVGEEAEPGATLFPADLLTVEEGSTSIYTLVLNREPLGDVVIQARVTGNSDVTIDTDEIMNGNQDTLTFTLENYRDPQIVTVRAASDDDAANDTASVTHSVVASQSSNEYDSVAIAALNVRINDDETAGVTVTESNLRIEEGRSDTYTVRLNTPPVGNVRIAVFSNHDYITVSPSAFTLTRSNWQRGQTVTVRSRNDDEALPVSARLTHTIDADATTADEYDGKYVARVDVDVIDDESPVDYDRENNGRIDITTREQLNAIRWDLDGDGEADDANNDSRYAAAFPRIMENMCDEDFTETAIGGDPGNCTGYELANDITLSGSWTPIGGNQDDEDFSDPAEYDAEFDGNGYTISNLSISRGDRINVGLFGAVGDGAEIREVGVVKANVRGFAHVGALAGRNNGTILGAWSNGHVSGNAFAGGLVGWNMKGSTVERSFSKAEVTGFNSSDQGGPLWSTRIAGLVGGNYGTIANTYATGSVRGRGHVAGLTGENSHSKGISNGVSNDISNSYSIGAVSTEEDWPFVGGLVGWQTATVTSSYWDTEASGQSEGYSQGEPSGAVGKTKTELQAPTGPDADTDGDGNPDTYVGWSASVWNFRDDDKYPCLIDVGDCPAPTATQPEPPDSTLQPVLAMRASVTVDAIDPVELAEGGSATYEMYLDGQPTDNVTITMSSDNGDITLEPSFLTFTRDNWHTAQSVTVRVAQDDDAANDTATVRHAVGGAHEYAGITVDTVAVAVSDDDTASITVQPTSLTLPEGFTGSYSISLSHRPVGEVRIFMLSDNPDVVPYPDPIIFTPDNWQTEQLVGVPAAHDDDVADDEAFITHGILAATGSGYTSATVASVVVSITDDDEPAAPGVTVSAADPVTVAEGGSATYQVSLDAPPTGDVTITASSDNGDVTAQPASLTFNPDNWQNAQTVTVSAAHDNDAVDDTAAVSHAVSGGNYDGVAAASVTVSIDDDDSAGVTVEPLTLMVIEGGDSASYTVVLDTEPSANVVIDVSSDSADVSTQPTELTFTTGDWQTAQTVTVSVGQDDDSDPDRATVSHEVSGAAEYDGIDAAGVTVLISDDDPITLPATDAGSVTVEPLTLDITEGGDGASYTVSLDVEPSANVVIDVSSDNADVSTQPASLTFTTGDWQTAQTVTVSAGKDDDSDDETATVSHQVSGGNYDGVTAASVAVSVTDDDQETEEPVAETDPNRAALEAFYNATGGASWTNNANWLSNRPLSEWHGVTTNGHGEVTTIVLDGNNLTGSLPAELGNLGSLTRLALNRNGLSGAIPSQLGSLPNLSIIGLARNQLSGSLPASLGNLPLTRLSLHDNTELSGPLPSGFTSMGSLQRLAIANTGICIPAGDAFTNWLATVPDKPGIDGLTTCASP